MQDEKKESRFSNLIKRAKKYAAISLGIGSLLFLGGKDQQSDTHADNVKIVQSVNTTISDEALNEKINYIVDNMLESNTTIVEQFKIDKTASKINSQIKKDSIRQNLLKYTSAAEGKKLLAALDVTKLRFIDTGNLHNGGGKIGGLYQKKGDQRILSMDFEDSQNLPILHHELTHIFQDQNNSYTKNGELAELEAHLSETRFTHQVIQQGILSFENLQKDSQNKLLNYQKYNSNDAQFTLNYLHPMLIWSSTYKNQFLLLSTQNTSEQLFQYARQLGLSGQSAQEFVQGLTNNDEIKQISYEIDKQGNETKIEKTGDFFGPSTMKQTGKRDGTLMTFQYQRVQDDSRSGSWQKIKERYEKGDHITETLFDSNGCETESTEIKGNTKKHTIFGTNMGARIETTNFVDGNNNQYRTVLNNMDPNFKGEIVQNFVNGQLVKESKTSLDGTTKTKELRNGKWVNTSQSLQQRLQKSSNQPDFPSINKQSAPEM